MIEKDEQYMNLRQKSREQMYSPLPFTHILIADPNRSTLQKP
ncbi:hypothetical protein B4119_1436 [Parageobacillus caldoxylosilyticus]|uniref:Uncharacterized protein n=1 Tax=Saccharococcus caldoxylosilyticus TaxID=81408 RepID=A0A150LPU5_9BACL|nr:hypothetical protein B4119_1436 [Parageobacillus caldoxylosilyticus]